MDQLQERMDKISQQQTKQMQALDQHIFNKSSSNNKLVNNNVAVDTEKKDDDVKSLASSGTASYDDDFNSDA